MNFIEAGLILPSFAFLLSFFGRLNVAIDLGSARARLNGHIVQSVQRACHTHFWGVICVSWRYPKTSNHYTFPDW